jgi:hypothetical protein
MEEETMVTKAIVQWSYSGINWFDEFTFTGVGCIEQANQRIAALKTTDVVLGGLLKMVGVNNSKKPQVKYRVNTL